MSRLVLIPLLTIAAAFACCSSPPEAYSFFETRAELAENLIHSIPDYVEDEGRAAEAMKLARANADQMRAFSEMLLAKQQAFFDANRNFDCPREDLDSMWDEFLSFGSATMRTTIENSLAMRQVIEEDEWNELRAYVEGELREVIEEVRAAQQARQGGEE